MAPSDPKRSRQASRLPDRPSDLVAVLDQPTALVEMSDQRFELLVEEFVQQGVPVLRAIETGAGLIAWAARHHYSDSRYGTWLHQFAEQLGRHEDTVTRWRDTVTRERGLPLPAVTLERSRARLQAAAAQVRRNAPKPAASRAEWEPPDLVLGEVTAMPVQNAVSLLLRQDPDVLAKVPTEDLRTLRDLVDRALAAQRREVLHARNARATRTGTK